MKSKAQNTDSDNVTDNLVQLPNDSITLPLFDPVSELDNDTDAIDYYTLGITDTIATTQHEGLYAEERPTYIGDNSWVVSLLILAFVFFAISYRRGMKYLQIVFTSLFKANARGNLFDITTVNENQLKLSLLSITFITEGIALYYILINNHITNTSLILPCIIICSLLCMIYFLLQRGVYYLLGIIFGDAQQASTFDESYTSVNLFVGLVFTPFILLMVFVPSLLQTATLICLILYIISRLIIMYIGIRIFSPHIFGLLYIILYLCALELAPLFLLEKGVNYIYRFLEINLI